MYELDSSFSSSSSNVIPYYSRIISVTGLIRCLYRDTDARIDNISNIFKVSGFRLNR